MKVQHPLPLPPAALRRRVRLEGRLPDGGAAPVASRLGQERALEAMDLAIAMEAPGYHLCLVGSPGLGRRALALEALAEAAGRRSAPSDWCYLYDFSSPRQPMALPLPAGRGRELAAQLDELVEDLLAAMPAAFQGPEFQRRATEIQAGLERREEALARELERQGREREILVLRTEEGYSLVPAPGGQALEPEAYHALPAGQRERLDRAMEEMKEALRETLVRLPRWRLEMRRRLRELEQETARLVVRPLVERLRRRWREEPVLQEWLEALERALVESLELFREEEERPPADDPRFRRFRVNVLVDNGALAGAPVVVEDHPTADNLTGRVEYAARMGALETDFTLIRAGALHRANGGFLVLELEKVLAEPEAWAVLKRALRAGEVRIDPAGQPAAQAGVPLLEPAPVPLALKVVLVAGRELFYELREADPEFALLFKVVADMAETLPRSAQGELAMARLAASLQRREKLRPFTRGALEAVVEERVRRAEEGDRLSLHLDSLLDLLRESDRAAARSGRGRVGREAVEAALAARRRRLGQPRERLLEQMLEGVIRIDTGGLQLGQVNALVYLEAGELAFGLPSRVSATARLGNGEFIDIERETELGGPIHSKGVMILTAYLAARYARHLPLPVTATLVFEQSYGPVEGDSASVAELCALLSALGDLPLRQSVAVTGSVNQHGQVQSVGGVCEKIEGFFDLCRARGLDGSHGVIIPASDVPDLMLDRAVVEAAEQGRFHVWAVDHVEQAMELLTGLPAGVADARGDYPPDSINGLVQARLAHWAALRRRLAGTEHEDG